MSWRIETFGNLLTESKIICENPNSDKRIRVKLNIKGVIKRPDANDKKGATKQYVRKAGQFIYGKQNFHKGAFGIIPKELDGFETSADIPSFDVREDCLPEWIYYYFKAGNRYLELIKYARGVGSKRIHPKQLVDLEIPLPPLEVQKKIIEELKDIEKDELSTQLTRQLDLVKQLRQAFLREAMQGKLIDNGELKIENEETGAELLAKIKAEKEKLTKAKKIKKQKPLPPIEKDEIPFEIPDNWVWCRLGEIVIMNYGSGLTKAQCIAGAKYPVFGSNGIVGYYNQFLTEKKAIIIGRKGSAGALNICETPSWTTDVAYYVEEDKYLFFNFVYILLKSLELEKLGKGIKPGVNRNDAYNYPVPLPPIQEQKAIVKKLDKLMTYCNSLEESIKKSQTENEMLLQQVLREALEPKTESIKEEVKL